MFREIEILIEQALIQKGAISPRVSLNWIKEQSVSSDATTTCALKYAKEFKMNPKDLANEIAQILNSKKEELCIVEINIEGSGYINFKFTDEFFFKNLRMSSHNILSSIRDLDLLSLKDKRVLVEYTDANPFKVFHIGHLMDNIIGECAANIYELSGAIVNRLSYQGDVGRHIAINIFSILNNMDEYTLIKNEKDVKKKVIWLGEKYALGYKLFDNDVEDGEIKSKVKEINKKIYEKSDEIINEIYENGRAWSLEYFETLYKLLGTKFDKYIFESETAPIGMDLLHKNINIFEYSEGAIIYDGEQDGLHKRVFVNSQGLPTYEAKDIGNMQIKLDEYKDAKLSVVITGNEQKEYFKVLYKVLEKIFGSNINFLHFSHGLMRFTDGKMSSRKGNIKAGDELVFTLMDELRVKFENSRIEDHDEKEEVIRRVAIGAIKYSVLKQAIGKDVVFDFDNAVRIDGDSGPYLQYTYARISGAIQDEFNSSATNVHDYLITQSSKDLIKLILRYEEVLKETISSISPQVLLSYLVELAREYNSFYASEKIRENIYNINLSERVRDVLRSGLHILGIKTPDRM
jgi:arginyl-tRNA synthetase